MPKLLSNMLFTLLCAGLPLLLASTPGRAAEAIPTLSYCVYDVLGNSGDYYAMAKDYQLAAKSWGVNLELKVYTNDTLAADDFKAGRCDMTNMLGLRARMFNTFTGTIDAPGAVEDYAQLRQVIGLLTSPKVARFMVQGPYEMAGLYPIGACYDFVRDRQLTTVAAFAHKKIAVMAWDQAEFSMAEQFGADPVPSDPTTLGKEFNSGTVDVMIGPAVLYKPYELYKGIGDQGGIIRRPILQLTEQLIMRRDKFPPGFGSLSRQFVGQQQDVAFTIIHNVENGIDPHHWIYMTVAERKNYLRVTQDARASLAKKGFYDKTMLSILKRVRCKSTQADSDCSDTEE